jgi:alkylation response protein AidB-like acyl-CoA dehydrogenase
MSGSGRKGANVIDFRLTEKQLEYQKIAHDFARDEIRPISLELDHQEDPAKSSYVPHLLEKMNAVGLRTMSIPKKYGGGGVDDLLTHCLVGEEMSWGDRGATGVLLSTTKMVHILTSDLIEDKEMADYWLREYVNDPTFLIGTATTEPLTGSENQLPYNGADGGYRTTAVRDGDKYIVNGLKHFISNVGHAKFMFTFVRTDPSVGVEQGATLLMVPMDAPGVSIGKIHNKMGYRLNQNAEIIFKNAEIPVKYRIGPENAGVSYIRRHLRGDALINAAGQIGTARAAYEASLEFAKNRIASGRPIAHHQSIGIKLVDMYTKLEAARALVWKGAWHQDMRHEIPIDPPLSLATSAFAHEISCDVTRMAMEIHAGVGVQRENFLEKWFRDCHNMLFSSDGGNNMKKVRAMYALTGQWGARSEDENPIKGGAYVSAGDGL